MKYVNFPKLVVIFYNRPHIEIRKWTNQKEKRMQFQEKRNPTQRFTIKKIKVAQQIDGGEKEISR